MDKDLRDQFTIVRKCRGKLDCLIYEMLFIKEKKPKLNTQSDCTENKTIRPFAWVDYVINGKQENSSLLNNFSSTSRESISKLRNVRSFSRISQKKRLQWLPKLRSICMRKTTFATATQSRLHGFPYKSL